MSSERLYRIGRWLRNAPEPIVSWSLGVRLAIWEELWLREVAGNTGTRT
jgi:hypothetical protein